MMALSRVALSHLFSNPSIPFFSQYLLLIPPRQTMAAGSIGAWNVEEGSSFIAGDVFCSVETDKATMDFEAQDDGFVARILAPSGPDEIKIGTPIMITVTDEDSVAAFKDYVVEAAAAAPTTPTPVVADVPTTPPTSPAAAPALAPVVTPSTTRQIGERIVASPLAHMLAKEMGYDITAIPGSGPDGRVIAADVKEFVPSTAAATATLGTTVSTESVAPAQSAMAAAPIVGQGYVDYPLSDHARELAARLLHSKRNVPHYYLTVDIGCDDLLAIRTKLNNTLGDDEQLSVYDLLIKAAALSMKTVPTVNASWLDSVVRVYDSVDVNIVVGSGDSLYTPVIEDAASKGLKQISKEVTTAVAVVDSADDEQVQSVLGGVGTFTIMNLGMYGIKSCAPIIREPQSCALAIGALENRIVPSDLPEELYKESVMFTATLSCDHRVVDGAVGAQWLSAFKSHVENPSTLLL
jgi:pyruvate dehydrogenase E2 component (dihydrolipoamide acetyltransferase)